MCTGLISATGICLIQYLNMARSGRPVAYSVCLLLPIHHLDVVCPYPYNVGNCIVVGLLGWECQTYLDPCTGQVVDIWSATSMQTKHIKVWYYYVADCIEKGDLSEVWCPTEMMIADFLTKLLQGKMSQKFRDVLMLMGVAPMWHDTD